jgi:hypothetical protein
MFGRRFFGLHGLQMALAVLDLRSEVVVKPHSSSIGTEIPIVFGL